MTSKKSLSLSSSSVGALEARACCSAESSSSFSATVGAVRFLKTDDEATVDVTVSSDWMDEVSEASESLTDAEAGEAGCCCCNERESQFCGAGGLRMWDTEA